MAETKKESFRKYLESAGVIDSLTKGMQMLLLPRLQVFHDSATLLPWYIRMLCRDPSDVLSCSGSLLLAVLVALYEEPDKPPNATSSIVQLLGGPSPEEYNALLAERDELAEKLKDAEEELAQLKVRPCDDQTSPCSLPRCHLPWNPTCGLISDKASLCCSIISGRGGAMSSTANRP